MSGSAPARNGMSVQHGAGQTTVPCTLTAGARKKAKKPPVRKKPAVAPRPVALFDEARMYPLHQPITYRDKTGVHTITEMSGRELNVAARVVYAEASGGAPETERQAVASVLWNRVGASGLNGGVQDSLSGAAFAKAPGATYGEFRSTTGPESETRKFREAADPSGMSPAEQADLQSSVDAVEHTVEHGPAYDYNNNRGGTHGQGTVLGGSRFWNNPGIHRRP